MAEPVQKKLTRSRPPRVRLSYEVEAGDTVIKKELPFIMGIMADLSGHAVPERSKALPPYAERRFIFINKDNFDDVLKEAKPALRLGTEDKPELHFSRLNDFHPAGVISQVPSLHELLNARDRLRTLAATLDGDDALHEQVLCLVRAVEPESVIKDLEAQRDSLRVAVSRKDEVALAAAKNPADAACSARTGDTNAGADAGQTDGEAAPLQYVEMLLECLRQVRDNSLTLSPGESVVEMLTLRVAAIDALLSEKLNAILHDPEFQKLEATWRGLHYLVQHTETGNLLKLHVLNVTFKELEGDLAKAVAFDQSTLFKHLYDRTYGVFGGEPYSCLLHVHEYGRDKADMELLARLAQVASAAHAPLLTAASPALFGMDSFLDLGNPRNLSETFRLAEYDKWHALRDMEEARYISMTLPRMLLRLPYGEKNVVMEEFAFEEDVYGDNHSKYLWGNSAFALARCITNAFPLYGWTAAIRGLEGGGIVEELPMHTFKNAHGESVSKLPTEVAVTDRREKELSDLGFITLVYLKNTDKAVFFGGQSIHKTPLYVDDDATANSRLSARLPYLLNASRFAHYVKSMMRDKADSFQSAESVANYLNTWISQYVLLADIAGQEIKAQYPLREARVDVIEEPDAPGAFRAIIYLRPHFQFEGMTASIRLVAKLPPSPGR